jgi:hypothetical protein
MQGARLDEFCEAANINLAGGTVLYEYAVQPIQEHYNELATSSIRDEPLKHLARF